MDYPLEYITWLDAEECNGWHIPGAEYKLAECESVGFVVHEDDLIVVLSTTRVKKDDDYLHSTRLKIPKSCITERLSIEWLE